MRGAERSAGNTAKNIALIVLAVLMAVLCAANWLAGVSAASLGSDNPLRRVHDRLFGGAAGYEIRSSGVSAASPAQLALGASGELVGVQYGMTDVDASLGAVRSIWTQALSGDALTETDEQTLAGELGAERKVLLRYHGALPLSVVSGWMGGTLADDRIKVETLTAARSLCARRTARSIFPMRRPTAAPSTGHWRTFTARTVHLRARIRTFIPKRCCLRAKI